MASAPFLALVLLFCILGVPGKAFVRIHTVRKNISLFLTILTKMMAKPKFPSNLSQPIPGHSSKLFRIKSHTMKINLAYDHLMFNWIVTFISFC